MRAWIIAVAMLAIGCAESRVIVAPDAGDAGETVDAPLETDAGPPIEPVPGGECDQQDECATCMQCSIAPHETCNNLALTCEEEPDCNALSTCLSECGATDETCARACAGAHPGGRERLLDLYECMLCNACPADCREHHETWCVAPPF